MASESLCPRCQAIPLPPATDLQTLRWAIQGQEVCADCFAAYAVQQGPAGGLFPIRESTAPAPQQMIRQPEETL